MRAIGPVFTHSCILHLPIYKSYTNTTWDAVAGRPLGEILAYVVMHNIARQYATCALIL